MTTPGHPPDADAPDAREMGAVAAGLLLAVPQLDPPPELKDRVMAITGAPPVSRPHPGRVPTSSSSTRAMLPAWLPAAAVAVVALGLLLYAVQLRGRVDALEGQLAETSLRLATAEADMQDTRVRLVRAQSETSVLAAPDLRRVDLAGQKSAEASVARAFWSRAHGLVLTATRLPDLPRGQTYQVWVLTDGAPISAGLFVPDAEGRAAEVFETPVSLPAPTGLAVSIEPAGGVPAPTGDIVLLGMLASGN